MEALAAKELSPIEKGIKLIGIGKHGSKKLPDELIKEITFQLQNEIVHPLLTGAFIGAMMMKDIEPSYLELEDYLGKGSLSNIELLWSKLCAEVPENLTDIAHRLLRKETLSVAESEVLGRFLFSEGPGEIFRGMAMSILRIRYEADEEYQGLYNVIKATYNYSLLADQNNQDLIQLAEPFDGVEHSYMITPLIAQELQKEGYRVVSTVGRNAGPKVELNPLDLFKSLNGVFVKNASDLNNSKPEFGWVIDQADISDALEKWVDRRKILMKRPFLATLEKVLNPLKANILITSVFHIPYLEKMVELGAMADFKAFIVLKRGLEGTLATSLSKASGILCAVKKKDGTIETVNIDATKDELAKYRQENDDVVENISIADNVNYIMQFLKEGNTGNADFDNRVNLTLELYKKGLAWIRENQEN